MTYRISAYSTLAVLSGGDTSRGEIYRSRPAIDSTLPFSQGTAPKDAVSSGTIAPERGSKILHLTSQYSGPVRGKLVECEWVCAMRGSCGWCTYRNVRCIGYRTKLGAFRGTGVMTLVN